MTGYVTRPDALCIYVVNPRAVNMHASVRIAPPDNAIKVAIKIMANIVVPVAYLYLLGSPRERAGKILVSSRNALHLLYRSDTQLVNGEPPSPLNCTSRCNEVE